MKALLVGVLAAALAGCSRQPPPLAGMPPCSGFTPCQAAVVMPAASPPPRHHMAMTKQASLVHRPVRRHAHAIQSAIANSTTTSVPAKNPARAIPLPPHAPATVAEPAPAAVTSRTVQQQVTAAATVAERMSTTDIKANEPKRSETASADAATVVPAGKADGLVVVLMARPDIKSLTELTGKNIAIDGKYATSNGSVRTAIAAAGALEVQLSPGQNLAIDRLVSGETPAAVLALVSAGAAESFPDIAGYKTFRVPLSPHALNKQP